MRPALVVGALAAAAVAAVASGCGGSTSGAGSLDPKVATAYVDAQARALCLVQSTAFPTQAALAEAYTRTLQSSALSPEELADARAAEAKDLALRTRLSDKVAALCG